MTLWYIGNTSVRSALRLRDGLIALADSPLQGHLRGREGDCAFRDLLGNKGIVSLGEDGSVSVGRKWRSALGKCGFLYPLIEKSASVRQEDVGPADTITPNGWRLIRSETVPAMQECFLRALAAQYFQAGEGENAVWYSPLRHTLALLLELERKTGEASMGFLEMALFAQTTSSADDLSQVAEGILSLRDQRKRAQFKRRFDSEKYAQAAAASGRQASTFRDYADANIRYLKATGLVQNKGRGIVLIPEKRLLAELMARDTSAPENELQRCLLRCNGAVLPTDSHGAALEVLHDLLGRLAGMGIPFAIGDRPIDTPADIAVLRHEIEEILARQKEETYAGEQAAQWEEIAAYLDLLATRKGRGKLDGGRDIQIPQAEAPAYLEWAIWRAFLAIGGLVNKPYDARRFRVDQDFLPVGTAPGNGPDMIMEFGQFVLAVEVTLMESSRQEAAEGEPVRRHVADLTQRFSADGRTVYGLFIANSIDSNTAETFRIGAWYTRSDERLRLRIIPLTIAQFGGFFRAMFHGDRACAQMVVDLMLECDRFREKCEAPEWKRQIEQTVSKTVACLNKDCVKTVQTATE